MRLLVGIDQNTQDDILRQQYGHTAPGIVDGEPPFDEDELIEIMPVETDIALVEDVHGIDIFVVKHGLSDLLNDKSAAKRLKNSFAFSFCIAASLVR